MKKPIFILTSLILTIIILFVVKTVVANGLSTSGVALGSAQEELAKNKTENTILREKIYSLSSLNYVSSVAARLGFVESKSSFALTKGLPIAVAQ